MVRLLPPPSRDQGNRTRERQQKTLVGLRESFLAAAPGLKAHLEAEPSARPVPLPGHTRVQAVVATAVCANLSSSSKASAGVLHPSVLRGLLLRAIATAARSSALCTLRSVPFGKYCRSSPLVFSFVPRCQGLWGSQK